MTVFPLFPPEYLIAIPSPAAFTSVALNNIWLLAIRVRAVDLIFYASSLPFDFFKSVWFLSLFSLCVLIIKNSLQFQIPYRCFTNLSLKA